MSDRWVKSGDLGVTKLLRIFAVLSILFLLILVIVPLRSYLTEWRDIQLNYNALAASQGTALLEPQILQIWKPKLGVVDRCTTCHIGMGENEPAPGNDLFAAHPKIPHDPADFGCTLCHGGQGRATTLSAGHGLTKHWDEPILEKRYFEAGCGSCHTHLRVPSAALMKRGENLFRRLDCIACHSVGGVGRGKGPDLTHAGLKGFDPNWHEAHMERKAKANTPEWSVSFRPVRDEDFPALDEYLKSLTGAPRLMEGKMLAHKLGCRGCHKINGVGGDDGPDLTTVGRKPRSELEYSGVRGSKTLPTWLKEHFLDPARVVQSSMMPDQTMTEDEAESLTLYILSLRGLEIPEAFWPKDKIRAMRLGEREFSTDGETLFGVFCAGCHGEKGQGRRYPTLGIVFPAIGNRDFLETASDDYLRNTIVHGRKGRRMPAWGEKDGGLKAKEIDAIIGYLRSLAPQSPKPFSFTLPKGEPSRGGKIFAQNCSGCHGEKGEGKEAPALANPQFQAAASDEYIAATIMRGRGGTPMPHFGQPTLGFSTMEITEASDLAAYIRTLVQPENAPSRKE